MYRVYEVTDLVRIPPNMFGEDINKVAEMILKDKYEAKLDKDLGLVIYVYDVKVDENGIIIPGDAAPYHGVRFKVLSFVPIQHEIVEGRVKDVINRGLFVDIGPLDAFVHISQTMDDDEIEFDDARGAIVGAKTRRFIERGDIVRARITNVSYSSPTGIPRIAMTMRQPYLGKLEWIHTK